MADLTDMKQDYIIIKPDAKATTAFNSWKSKLSTGDKDKFALDDSGVIFCPPDPDDKLTKERDELVALVENNSESVQCIVRLRFFSDGTISMISSRVNDPEDDK